MPSNSAEYMREYRKRRKVVPYEEQTPEVRRLVARISEIESENRRLTEEVARLKRLLAERAASTVPIHVVDQVMDPAFVQFRPAPKPSSQKHR